MRLASTSRVSSRATSQLHPLVGVRGGLRGFAVPEPADRSPNGLGGGPVSFAILTQDDRTRRADDAHGLGDETASEAEDGQVFDERDRVGVGHSPVWSGGLAANRDGKGRSAASQEDQGGRQGEHRLRGLQVRLDMTRKGLSLTDSATGTSRKRKVRCSAAYPTCGFCRHRNLVCVYDGEPASSAVRRVARADPDVQAILTWRVQEVRGELLSTCRTSATELNVSSAGLTRARNRSGRRSASLLCGLRRRG